MIAHVAEYGARLGIAVVCAVLAIPRASFYRLVSPVFGPPRPRKTPRALSSAERQTVLDTLHEDRFVDQAPAEVYATLLDEGQYLCSERTMYRVLAANAEVRERRNQLRHPAYAKPELLATRPNQLWSWDITKLLGPETWTYFYLYVVIDVFSRYVVAWMVATEESATLAERLVSEAYEREGIQPGQLTLHADRGASMTSKMLAHLLSDLGVTKTHSRPHVSDDNPYSESQFKTMQYRPDFPDRFGSLEDARSFCRAFFDWYNHGHHHGGLGLHTPHEVHSGLAKERRVARAHVLAAAHGAHPERFVNGVPSPPVLPDAVWINKPEKAPGVELPAQRAGERIADAVANSGRAEEGSRAQAAESAERLAKPTLDASEHGEVFLEVRDARAASLASTRLVTRRPGMEVREEVQAH
jgi:putative transposase